MEERILDAMNAANEIDFNLQGMDMSRAYTYEGLATQHNITNWEFQQIMQNQDLFTKTKFYNLPAVP